MATGALWNTVFIVKLLPEAYSGPCRTSMTDLICENS